MKYPANPPAVGEPDTLAARTIQFFSMQAISVLAAIVAVLLARRLLAQFGSYRAVVSAIGTYVLIVVAAAVLLPAVNELGNFPADTLWDFRRASLLTGAAMWAMTGVVLTGLIGRAYDRAAEANARRHLALGL